MRRNKSHKIPPGGEEVARIPSVGGQVARMPLDEETLQTLRRIREDLDLGQDIEEEITWEDTRPWPQEIDTFIGRVCSLKEKLCKRLWGKGGEQEHLVESNSSVSGCELTRELEDAWNLYTRGGDSIPSRDVGYVLRILGQNPTEDQIVEMVMKANCDWEGVMGRADFVEVGVDILRSSCDQMDDVRAAFRVFDHNNDGSISKEELREAMVNFGTRCTDEEFEVMFSEADKNDDGKIDFDEFVAMMLPTATAASN